MAWDRFAYSNNNPVIYNDPSGHEAVCGLTGDDNCGADFGPKEATPIIYAPDDALDNVWTGTELILSFLAEPADWVMTGKECLLLDKCSPYMLLGLLPFLPNSIGKYGDEFSEAIIKQIAQASARGERIPGGITILGSFPDYIDTGKLEGFTYFDMDPEVWKALQQAGDEYIQAVNIQFLEDSIQAGHRFVVTLNEGRIADNSVGKWLTMELQYIQERGYRLINGIFQR